MTPEQIAPNFEKMSMAEIADEMYKQGVGHAIKIIEEAQEMEATDNYEIQLLQSIIDKLEELKK